MQFVQSAFKILSNFVLYEYSAIETPATMAFLGIDGEGRIKLIEPSKYGTKIGKTQEIESTSPGEVFNVITQKFHGLHLNYLVCKKDGESFNNTLHDVNRGTTLDIGSSQAAPFIVSDPTTCAPLIAIPNNNQLGFFSVEDNKLIDHPDYKINGVISPSHTSAFIDLTGNLMPDLALNMISEGNNYLSIHSFNTNTREVVQRIPLPESIGPTLFFDFRKKLCYDLVYISIVNNQPLLNIHLNANVPDTEDMAKNPLEYFNGVAPSFIYKETPDYSFNLLSKINGMPVLTNAHGAPTGLYLADIDTNGTATIFITMSVENRQVVRCLVFDPSTEAIEVSKYDQYLEKHNDVISVTATDLNDRGKIDLVINKIEDGVPLLLYERIPSPDSNCHLSLKSLTKLDNLDSYIPGVTYVVHYENSKCWRKSSQMSSTAYPSFQGKESYIGLGPTNFFLNLIIAKTNVVSGIASVYKISENIIPNTSVVLLLNKDKWSMQTFLLYSKYATVACCLAAFLIINIVFLIYMAIKDCRMDTKMEIDNKRLRPLFSAL